MDLYPLYKFETTQEAYESICSDLGTFFSLSFVYLKR